MPATRPRLDPVPEAASVAEPHEAAGMAWAAERGGIRFNWFWDVPQFRRAFGLILVFALSAFLLLPLLTLLLWAFADLWRYPSVFPQHFSLRWWDWVFHNGDVGSAVRYSFITAPVVTLLAAVICLPAAYSFSRFRFPGRRGVFWKIPLPLALPAIIVASFLAFLAAFDEAQGTLVVGSPTIVTMPVLMYTLVVNYPEPVGAIFSILVSAPSVLLLVIARRFLLAGYLAAGFKGR